MTQSNYIFIPKLIDNIKIKENPFYKEIKEESNKYILESLELDESNAKIFDINLAYWSSICYPDINIKNRIYNITNFYTLLFIIDDLLENDISTKLNYKRYIHILEENLEPSTSIEKTFKNVWDNIKNDLSFNQKIRFIDYIKEWIEGAKYLACIDKDIDINTYMYYRYMSIGANSSFISIEYGLNINFEQEIIESYKEIHKIAAENIIFVNDLFSYRKEIYENNNINIIKIIMNEKNCKLQEAIDFLEINIKENYKLFEKIYKKILIKYNNENVKRYLDSLYNMIIGNLQWSCTSSRYHGLDFNNTLINGGKVIFSRYKTILVNE
jgi:hypothetical protein